MTTKIPMEEPVDKTVKIGCIAKDGLVHIYGTELRDAWKLMFTPDEAVKLWRVMAAGQYTSLEAKDVRGIKVKVSVGLDKAGRVTDDSGDMYTIQDGTGEVLLTLTPDQALVLAWTLKRCCEIAMYTDAPFDTREKSETPEVWVLACRRMLTGDATGDGTDLIGGHEEVFATEDAAKRHLRDFIRPLVKESHPAGRFHDEEELNGCVNEVIGREGDSYPNEWTYDGSTQSFEVTLKRREIQR